MSRSNQAVHRLVGLRVEVEQHSRTGAVLVARENAKSARHHVDRDCIAGLTIKRQGKATGPDRSARWQDSRHLGTRCVKHDGFDSGRADVDADRRFAESQRQRESEGIGQLRWPYVLAKQNEHRTLSNISVG